MIEIKGELPRPRPFMEITFWWRGNKEKFKKKKKGKKYLQIVTSPLGEQRTESEQHKEESFRSCPKDPDCWRRYLSRDLTF